MRFFIGMVLALGFIGAGVFPVVGGFSMIERGVTGDDIYAAFIIGGVLIFVGLLIMWMVIKSRKKRSAIDPAELTATLTGIAVGSGYGEDFSDDFD